jgi:hypothetical protein
LVHAPADFLFETTTRDGHDCEIAAAVFLPAAEVKPAQIAAHRNGRRAAAHERRHEIREELRHDLLATSEQGVNVPALRHATAHLRIVRETIALDDRDAFEMLGQHTRGKQPCDAGADDNGVAVAMMNLRARHVRVTPSKWMHAACGRGPRAKQSARAESIPH